MDQKIYTVKAFGNSAHVVLPKKLIGRKVKVQLAKNILTEKQQADYKARLASYEADLKVLKSRKIFNKDIIIAAKQSKIQEIKDLLSEFEEE